MKRFFNILFMVILSALNLQSGTPPANAIFLKASNPKVFHAIRKSFPATSSAQHWPKEGAAYVLRELTSENDAVLLISIVPITNLYTGDDLPIYGYFTIDNKLAFVYGDDSLNLFTKTTKTIHIGFLDRTDNLQTDVLTIDREDCNVELPVAIWKYKNKHLMLHGQDFGDIFISGLTNIY